MLSRKQCLLGMAVNVLVAVVLFFFIITLSGCPDPQLLKRGDPVGYFAMTSYGSVDLPTVKVAAKTAAEALQNYGPWGAEGTAVLAQLAIATMDTDEWFSDEHQKRVAGMAWPEHHLVWVGHNMDALCHEMAEVLYWNWQSPGGCAAFHYRDTPEPCRWPGYGQVVLACDKYVAAWRATPEHAALGAR